MAWFESIPKCPACKEVLVTFELESVEVDRCVVCRGTWLDAGELEQIARLAGADVDRLLQELDAAKTGGRSDRRCPRCGRKMERITVGETQPVELDRCRRGHGLWFDAGEMKTLVESAEEGRTGIVARFFAGLYRSELESDTGGQ